MKKLLYVCFAFFAIQVGFAQASPEAKAYIKNLKMKESLDQTKVGITNLILNENLEKFNTEFDNLINTFIADFENLVNENYTAEDLNKLNKSIESNSAPEPIAPKDAVAFQEKANKIQEEMGMSLQGIVMKYGDPVKLEEMEKEQ